MYIRTNRINFVSYNVNENETCLSRHRLCIAALIAAKYDRGADGNCEHLVDKSLGLH